MRCLRRILGLSLLDRIPNSVILARCGQQPIKEQLRLQRLLWLGHLVRMPDTRLPKLVFFSQLAAKRPRGRPLVRLREDVLRADVHSKGIATSWRRLAVDRAKWNEAVRQAQT
ncbi:hypothetical protein N2152v2_010321 [Parachlorella kessleri]